MSTVFIGGSRSISRLPAEVVKRLDNIAASGHLVVVGDANGVDKAVQKHFLAAGYGKLTVYCSDDKPRNNIGLWPIHNMKTINNINKKRYRINDISHDNNISIRKGFQFYAAKDREMARAADFGFMIWDGKSPGTVLNVLRLVRAGKISVLFNVPEKAVLNIKSNGQWDDFLAHCSEQLRADIKKRATPEEWSGPGHDPQPSLLAQTEPPDLQASEKSDVERFEEAISILNRALASGDTAMVMDTLGGIARSRGMSQVARDTGLARESLYRSLDAGGNPEFATILKVIASMGLRLEVKGDGTR